MARYYHPDQNNYESEILSENCRPRFVNNYEPSPGPGNSTKFFLVHGGMRIENIYKLI